MTSRETILQLFQTKRGSPATSTQERDAWHLQTIPMRPASNDKPLPKEGDREAALGKLRQAVTDERAWADTDF
jgi:hypothetical protein